MSRSRHPEGFATAAAVLILLLSLPCSSLAQRIDPISAAPEVVPLRPIWSRSGNGTGIVVAGLPDFDGDGRDEFGIADNGDQQWRVFGLEPGGTADTLWKHRAASPEPIAAGRFFGDDRRLLVVQRERDTDTGTQYNLDLFDVASGRVADTPHIEWSSTMPDLYLASRDFHIADLDNDGDDELIIVAFATRRGSTFTFHGEIWVYEGGPSFQLDTPSVVIRDNKHHGNYYQLSIGRIDADAYPDLLCVTYTGGRIRWGGPDLSAFDRPVDREFSIAGPFLDLLDADGDRQADLLWNGGYLHLSSSGKDPHTRAFDQADADRVFTGRGTNTFVLGPLNDSADRYDMFGLNSALGDGQLLMFSGGHNGPDARYEATYRDIRLVDVAAGDVDGNGWRDFLAGDHFSGDGLAVVLGGGPYIPRDSMPASAIRDIALEGHDDAITIWPNPATDVVHIAWRGDLSRTPSRFEVHDILGRRVADGLAEPGSGEVVWRCEEMSEGLYVVSVFDAKNQLITSTQIIRKQCC
jgi:hypothetical protein